MKKLLLAICTIAATSAFAQKDISMELTSPASGTQVAAGQTMDITFIARNVGSTAIDAADTLSVQFTMNGTVLTLQIGSTTFNTFLIDHGSIGAGDTIKRSYAISMSSTPPHGSTFCVVAKLRNNNSNIDANVINNTSCSYLNINAGISDLAKAAASVKVYPNPAKDFINFSIEGNVAKTMTISDITGKQVNEMNINSNDMKVDLSQFNNGLYLYQIKAENGEVIKSGKFNISK